MADKKVAVTPGSGEDIAFSTLGGSLGDAQIVKVDLGPDGASSPLVRGQQAMADSIPVTLPSDQAAIPVTDNSGSLTVDNAGTFAVQAAQSGTWNVTNISGTVSLPTGAATAAKQPALGTAGSASSDVITVQGVASMTPVQVSQATASNLNATVVGTGTFAVQAAQSGTWNVTVNTALPAGTNNIGDVDVLTVPSDPFGANADAASATGSISAKLRFIASTGIPITGTVTVGSHAVTNAGTFAVQESGSALTALQLIDDVVHVDDTATHSTGSTKGVGIMAAATPTDGSVNANDIGMVAMTTDRKLHVAVMDALPAGTAAIGKLAANSGVDIGDVDVTSIVPGTGATNLGKAEDGGHTTGDVGVMALGVANEALANISGTTLDYTPLATELSGRVVVAPFAPTAARAVGTASVAGTTSTSVVAASGDAGLRTYITSVQVANTGSSATLITLQDGNGGTALAYTIAPAAGGSNLYFPVPIRTTANTALYFACGTSSTTVYVSAQGYKAP